MKKLLLMAVALCAVVGTVNAGLDSFMKWSKEETEKFQKLDRSFRTQFDNATGFKGTINYKNRTIYFICDSLRKNRKIIGCGVVYNDGKKTETYFGDRAEEIVRSAEYEAASIFTKIYRWFFGSSVKEESKSVDAEKQIYREFNSEQHSGGTHSRVHVGGYVTDKQAKGIQQDIEKIMQPQESSFTKLLKGCVIFCGTFMVLNRLWPKK